LAGIRGDKLKIYFSRHAKRQMKWRKISETEKYSQKDILNIATENLFLEEPVKK